jgi:hypothetical protein
LPKSDSGRLRKKAFMKYVALVHCFAILLSCNPDANPSDIPVSAAPNILLILADDMGKDAGPGFSEGSFKPNRPNLAKIRNEGLVFNNRSGECENGVGSGTVEYPELNVNYHVNYPSYDHEKGSTLTGVIINSTGHPNPGQLYRVDMHNTVRTLLARGKSQREIAHELGIHRQTVRKIMKASLKNRIV